MVAGGGQRGDGEGEAGPKRSVPNTKRPGPGRPEALDRNSPSEALPSSTIERPGLNGKSSRREGTPARAN
jgi:hypothetical protein